MTTETPDNLDSTYLFHQLDNYQWDEDEEFQGGLQAILGSVQNPEQVDHLTLRAKCYYYARKAGTPVDFNGYKEWVENQRNGNGSEATGQAAVGLEGGASAEASGGMDEAPKPASFADICELIADGKPIPGIKDIPDTILEGQASEDQTASRKKPWEKSANAEVNPSWMN